MTKQKATGLIPSSRTELSIILVCMFILCLTGHAPAEEPYWWNSPHRDDTHYLYERGSAVNSPTEQSAVLEAILSAKNMLMHRIGISPALTEAGINVTAEYALVNIETSGITTEKSGDKWNAWLLVKYPQKEKQILLDRWNASIASLQALRREEKKISPRFGLSLNTADIRSQYREGESIIFSVTAEIDCYLLLVDHMSDGTTVLLFPNRYNPDSFIRKGQKILIPSPGSASFKLLVTPPFGDDRIEAIASTKKSSLHARIAGLIDVLPPARDVAVVTRGIFVQGLADALGDSAVDDTRWSQAELTLSTYPK